MEEGKWKKVKRGYTHFTDGDALFAKITPCFENSKATVIEGFPNGYGAGSTEYYVLQPIVRDFETKLLHAIFKTKDFLTLGAVSMTGSVGQKRVPKDFVRSYSFPVPPLAEQKQIVAKLEELLAQVDAIKARLDAIPGILKRFRQSVLAAAVSGLLTEEWRGDSTCFGWKKAVFEELVTVSMNGISKRRSSEGKKFTVLKLSDFKNGERIFGNERKIRLSEKEIAKYSLQKGDLLAIRVNGSVELAALFTLYEEDLEEAYCDHFIRFTVNQKKLSPKFFTFVSNTGDGRRHLRDSLSTSAGQNTVNQKSIKALRFNLPPIEEQNEIVRRVDQLFAFAGNIEQRVKEAQNRVNQLTQSILVKAFRGDLTAEWREQNPHLITGENSAEALLNRIKAERAAKASKKKNRQRRAKPKTEKV